MDIQYFVYMMANQRNTVIYTGVTNNLKRRVYEHKESITGGFTSKYNVNKLVYYEIYSDVESAITREKQIKAGSRSRKIKLIQNMNADWKDLYDEI